jgi:hypothetical protein
MPSFKVDTKPGLMIEVDIDDIEVDYFGPWSDIQSARQWCAAMLASLQRGERHYPEQDNRP